MVASTVNVFLTPSGPLGEVKEVREEVIIGWSLLMYCKRMFRPRPLLLMISLKGRVGIRSNRVSASEESSVLVFGGILRHLKDPGDHCMSVRAPTVYSTDSVSLYDNFHTI